MNLENAVEIPLGDDEPDYQMLSNSDMDLIDLGSVLRGSAHYQVLKHIAWRQPGLSKATARPLHIHGGAEFNTQSLYQAPQPMSIDDDKPVAELHPPLPLRQFDGIVKVVLGRYLHFYTDLIFLHPSPSSNEPHTDQQSDTSISFTYYRVKSHRRMRSRELHYLDHPLLGILVQITPLSLKTKSVIPKKGQE
jgi:hypothetical protein